MTTGQSVRERLEGIAASFRKGEPVSECVLDLTLALADEIDRLREEMGNDWRASLTDAERGKLATVDLAKKIEIQPGWTVTEAGGGWYLVDDNWHLRLFDAGGVLREAWVINDEGPWGGTMNDPAIAPSM